MSASIDNTGLVILGTCDDGVPSAEGVSFPTASGCCLATATYKTDAKTKKATASGKSGAKTTYTGKKVCEIEIDLTWLDRSPVSDEVEAALLTISTGGPNDGKVWDWTERWAALHQVGAVMVESFDGPKPAKNSDEVTAKIKCSGWTKPINSGVGQGTTPTAPAPAAVPDPQNAVTGGSLGASGVKFTNAPTVTP